MTLLIFLAVSSLVWGAVLWSAGRLLQRPAGVSGNMRQWIWRGATLLLVAPWIAAPLVMLFGLGLAAPETAGEVTVLTTTTTTTITGLPAADHTAFDSAVAVDGGTIWSYLAALSALEIAVLVVVAGWLVRFVMAQLALRNLLGIVMLSRKTTKGPASDSVRKWSNRLKLSRTPGLRVVGEQHSPFSYGIVSPTVCLPDGMEDKLSKQSLDLVVGHECLHVARGDGWLRPLERVAADIFWFNPFAWLIRRELDVARELAVDEAVVQMAESRIAYARTLREVAGFSAGLPANAPAATMALAGGRNLMLRVTRTLADAKRKPARAAILAAALVGLAGAPIAVAQVMLAIPAPPAPPAVPAIDAVEAPEAPAVPELPEFASQPEAPEAPEILEAPPAPQPPEAPEAPAAAEFSTKDGIVRATFRARVLNTSGDATNGFRVELLQTAPGATGETCLADLSGLGGLSVSKGDVVSEGGEVGTSRKSGRMRFAVSCSDQLDSQGRPVVENPPEAPEPPAAPSPASHIAPAAPVASPSPVRAVAPVAPPAPAPYIRSATSPAPYVSAPPVAPAPPAPYVPSTSLTPAVAPPPPASPVAPAAPAPLRQSGNLDIGPTNHAVLATGRRSSPFGEREDPVGQGVKIHAGVDIAAARGAAIRTPVDARVVRSGMVDGYGNLVELLLTNGYVIRMSQMDEIKVATGANISAGAVIGSVGSSGLATGPHLHLEVLVDGKAVNPETVKGLKLIARP